MKIGLRKDVEPEPEGYTDLKRKALRCSWAECFNKRHNPNHSFASLADKAQLLHDVGIELYSVNQLLMYDRRLAELDPKLPCDAVEIFSRVQPLSNPPSEFNFHGPINADLDESIDAKMSRFKSRVQSLIVKPLERARGRWS